MATVPHPWRPGTRPAFRIIGTASTLSDQLAAIWPMFRLPNYKQINSDGGQTQQHETSPRRQVPQSSPAADLEGGE